MGVLELAPPAVQADLMTGSATNPNALPLADVISETMALLREGAGTEVLMKHLGHAECEGRYAPVFGMLNGAQESTACIIAYWWRARGDA